MSSAHTLALHAQACTKSHTCMHSQTHTRMHTHRFKYELICETRYTVYMCRIMIRWFVETVMCSCHSTCSLLHISLVLYLCIVSAPFCCNFIYIGANTNHFANSLRKSESNNCLTTHLFLQNVWPDAKSRSPSFFIMDSDNTLVLTSSGCDSKCLC